MPRRMSGYLCGFPRTARGALRGASGIFFYFILTTKLSLNTTIAVNGEGKPDAYFNALCILCFSNAWRWVTSIGCSHRTFPHTHYQRNRPDTSSVILSSLTLGLTFFRLCPQTKVDRSLAGFHCLQAHKIREPPERFTEGEELGR